MKTHRQRITDLVLFSSICLITYLIYLPGLGGSFVFDDYSTDFAQVGYKEVTDHITDSFSYIRVDTVHQGDQDGIKGVYHINAVDEITQYEIVLSCSRISEHFLIPVLTEM